MSDSNLETVWTSIATVIRRLEDQGRRPVGANVKSYAQVELGRKIVESDLGYRNFKELATAGAAAGYFRIVNAFRKTDFVLGSADNEFRVLADVVQHMNERGRTPVGATVKPLLREALGGSFDERKLGYFTFKDFASAAAQAGYVTIDHSPELPDFRLLIATSDLGDQVQARPLETRSSNRTLDQLEETFDTLREIAIARHNDGVSLEAGTTKTALRPHFQVLMSALMDSTASSTIWLRLRTPGTSRCGGARGTVGM